MTTSQTIATGDLDIECGICKENAWQGALCGECPLNRKRHYAQGLGTQPHAADFFVVAESPHILGPSGNFENHTGWKLDTEKLVHDTVRNLKKSKQGEYTELEGRYTYAVRCIEDKPKKKAIDCCSMLFHKELVQYAVKNRPIMVFALGPAVLKSLGVKYGKYNDVQGKFLEVSIRGRRVLVYPSLSKRQLATKAGYVTVMSRHLSNFLDGALANKKGHTVATEVSMAQIIEEYVFPQTAAEVHELVQHIINYARPGADAKNSMLALDTETNTLFPHRPKLKMLSLVAAWDKGKACSIPFEHPNTPWKVGEVRESIWKLLTCAKPKVGHNFKFDIKVLARKGFKVRRVSWDTMLGEHLLEEDKKGYYSLKHVTKAMLPKYAGYEDQLHDILNLLEAPTLLQQLEQEASGVTPVIPKSKLKGAAKKLAEDEGFLHIPLKELNEYGAIDGDVTRQLAGIQRKRIEVEQHAITKKRRNFSSSNNAYFKAIARPGNSEANPLEHLMIHHCVPATKTLADMEAVGMRVDREYVEDLLVDMDQSLRESRQELNLMIPPGVTFKGEPFNPGSAPNIRKILFGTGYLHPKTKETVCYQGIIEPPTTTTGLISTNQAFLRSIFMQHNCPFAAAILSFRATSKARNTFVSNVYTLSAEDGRMHTSFHIAGSATGRLASSNENMQNIPLRIRQHNLKQMFIPTYPEKEVIVNADAKAAEVRVYAAYSNDANLIKALNDGMDPHSFFASMIYRPEVILKGVPKELTQETLQTVGIDEAHRWSYDDFQNRDNFLDTDKPYGAQLNSLRKTIKRVVFGILYGASRKKISHIVGIPPEQADVIIRTLFKMFPTIEKYIENTEEQVKLLGIVETFFGRRRRFDLSNLTFSMRNKAKRQAVNFKIQSTSSDMVLSVLSSMVEPLKRDFNGRMLITVHDSVVFELEKKYVSQMPDFIHEYGVKQVAERFPWMPVPFQWDVEVGPSYGELTSVENYITNNPKYAKGESDEYIERDIRSEFTDIGN